MVQSPNTAPTRNITPFPRSSTANEPTASALLHSTSLRSRTFDLNATNTLPSQARLGPPLPTPTIEPYYSERVLAKQYLMACLEKGLGPGLDIPIRYYMLHGIVVQHITPSTLPADTKRCPDDLDIRLLLWSEKAQVLFNKLIHERKQLLLEFTLGVCYFISASAG